MHNHLFAWGVTAAHVIRCGDLLEQSLRTTLAAYRPAGRLVAANRDAPSTTPRRGDKRPLDRGAKGGVVGAKDEGEELVSRMMGFRVAAEYLVRNGGKLEDIMGPAGFDAEGFERGHVSGEGLTEDGAKGAARGGSVWEETSPSGAVRLGDGPMGWKKGSSPGAETSSDRGVVPAWANATRGVEGFGGMDKGALQRGSGARTGGHASTPDRIRVADGRGRSGAGWERIRSPRRERGRAEGEERSRGAKETTSGDIEGSGSRDGGQQASRCPFAALWS